MGNTHAAEKIFWELVEDFDEWTRRRLEFLKHDASAPAEKTLAIAHTTTHLLNATARPARGTGRVRPGPARTWRPRP